MSPMKSERIAPDLGVQRPLDRVLEGGGGHGRVDGGENRNPGRTMNVYVRPSADTVGMACATSGTRRVPAGAGRSG